MGHGIAQVAAAAGYKVLLRDVDRESLARGIQAIERNLAKGIQLGKLTEADRDSTLQHIRGTTQLEEIANADLIIEAAPEQLELKQELLREVETHSSKAFIFATNTSSLSITEIAKASERPRQVVGMHFFNPVHLMRLVEIVVGKATGDDTVETVREVSRRLRKEPIVVRDVPGFASSRLGVALGLEAMRMLEQGVASAKDIDTAMELGLQPSDGSVEADRSCWSGHPAQHCRVSISRAGFRNISAAGSFAAHGKRRKAGQENRRRVLQLERWKETAIRLNSS